MQHSISYMKTSGIFTLNWGDIGRGVVVAVLTGALLPVLAIIQTPGFDVTTANWGGILALFENGALAGLAGYLTKNLFTTADGKFVGLVG